MKVPVDEGPVIGRHVVHPAVDGIDPKLRSGGRRGRPFGGLSAPRGVVVGEVVGFDVVDGGGDLGQPVEVGDRHGPAGKECHQDRRHAVAHR